VCCSSPSYTVHWTFTAAFERLISNAIGLFYSDCTVASTCVICNRRQQAVRVRVLSRNDRLSAATPMCLHCAFERSEFALLAPTVLLTHFAILIRLHTHCTI
jgi:hypothetical protein